jgi:hypothetical protein
MVNYVSMKDESDTGGGSASIGKGTPLCQVAGTEKNCKFVPTKNQNKLSGQPHRIIKENYLRLLYICV